MLFAPDSLILQVCPAHRTDLILRKVNVDRYDDRDLVRTNLIDSYDRILAFVKKHLPDPFYLEGIERRSLRDAIFREVASNMLIHREYASGIPARLVIEYGSVTTYNANRPHGFGALNPETFAPYPKNPVIGAFFREINRADELGSGMRKMMLYGKQYGDADPQLIEGDVFRMIVKVPEFSENPANTPEVTEGAGTKSAPSRHQADAQVTVQVTAQVTAQVAKFCIKAKTAKEIMGEVGLKHWKTFQMNYLNPLLDAGLLERTIPDKPRSSKQKYRLTQKGKEMLESNRGDR